MGKKIYEPMIRGTLAISTVQIRVAYTYLRYTYDTLCITGENSITNNFLRSSLIFVWADFLSTEWVLNGTVVWFKKQPTYT